MNSRTYTLKIPKVGYASFSIADGLFILIGLAISFWGLHSFSQGLPWPSIIVSFVQIVCGLGIIGVSILTARDTFRFEHWVNPISQMEAWRNHATAEGYL